MIRSREVKDAIHHQRNRLDGRRTEAGVGARRWRFRPPTAKSLVTIKLSAYAELSWDDGPPVACFLAPEPGLLRLRNCPFHSVAASYPELVCGLNLALIEGLLAGLGDNPENALLAPEEGACCVAIRTRATNDRERPR